MLGRLLNRAGGIALLLALLLAVTVSVSAQESISPGSTVEGESTGDPVTYTIDASAGELLIITMSSDALDSFLRVQQNGSELASDDDGAGYPDAMLAFVVPADGSYDIVADQAFGSDSGAFTLQVDSVTPTAVEAGGSAVLEPASDGSLALYAVLNGVEGEVVNIWANSNSDEDVSVRLVGANGEEIEEDDDDGPGRNAQLRRVVLPATGPNLIEVTTAFSSDVLMAPVELTVEATESLTLSADPQPMVLGDGEGQTGTEVYTVEMEAGTTYRFIVTIPAMPDDEGGVQMELFGTDRFFEPEIEAQHATLVAWDYTATSSGTVRLVVHPNFFSDDLHSIEYTIAMEVVG